MDSQSIGNKIALASLFTSVAAIAIGSATAIVPQEIKCTLGLLPRTCGGVYFISDSAYIDVGEADQRAVKLKKMGYSDPGHFFIPDYPNLSGKHLHVVYARKFDNRDDCAHFLEKYSQANPESYCFRASSNPSVEPDRFCSQSTQCPYGVRH
jgi:hypothetical protein